MIRSLYTAATGMQAQQINIDVLSNNLANVNTTGFKRSRADFQDLMYQTLRLAGATNAAGGQVPTGIQIGLGVKPAAVQKIFSQGDFVRTENPLDLVIEGNGFFQVTRPDGTLAYTRAGNFKLNSDGNVVNSDGLPLEPAITIPPDATTIDVSRDGIVTVQQPGTTTPTQVGQLTLARFANPGGLNAIGGNLFIPTAASGDPTTTTPGLEGVGETIQGFIEQSNVNIADEMVTLIISQRAYELNSKAVQASDEMLQVAANLRR